MALLWLCHGFNMDLVKIWKIVIGSIVRTNARVANARKRGRTAVRLYRVRDLMEEGKGQKGRFVTQVALKRWFVTESYRKWTFVTD